MKRKRRTCPELDEQQHRAFDLITDGQSLLLTGPGGCGKTFTLNRSVRELQDELGKTVVLSAPTGCAAVLIGGQTLHSFFWATPAMTREQIVARVTGKTGKTLQKSIQRIDTLVIDEISMVSDWWIDLIDTIFKLVRHNEQPFGGVQMIFVGDFLQLPPIGAKYSFHARAWKELHNLQRVN